MNVSSLAGAENARFQPNMCTASMAPAAEEAAPTLPPPFMKANGSSLAGAAAAAGAGAEAEDAANA